MSDVTHMNESRHTCEWVMSRVWNRFSMDQSVRSGVWLDSRQSLSGRASHEWLGKMSKLSNLPGVLQCVACYS